MSEPAMYRHRPFEREAFLYEGEFPLGFLLDSEAVRKCGTDGVEILRVEGDNESVVAFLRPGSYLTRGTNGHLHVYERDQFEHLFAPVRSNKETHA
jgi:hypothetical protein